MSRHWLVSTLLVGVCAFFLFLGDSALPAMARPEGMSASLAREWQRPSASRPGPRGSVGPRSFSSIGMDAPRVSGDEHWAGMFTTSGVTDAWSGSGTYGIVNALASDGQFLYVGGDFSRVDGASTSYIARWDGATWSPLGSGTNSEVDALALDSSGNLYAGGSFTTAGGVTVNGIAKWDGGTWSGLGSGVSGCSGGAACVSALVVDTAGNLYAGGSFASAGGVAANNIAKWDGRTWSPLGSGTNGVYGQAEVDALAFDAGGNLYAGGWFTTAGGVTVNGIAKWNGSTWSALGSGVSGCYAAPCVSALVFDAAGNLYAGGSLQSAGGVSANKVAKWDGHNWSALGSGPDNGSANVVSALMLDRGGNLLTATKYENRYSAYITISVAGRTARWNGSNWTSLGDVMSGLGVRALALGPGGQLYAGGQFSMIGTTVTNSIARWDGSTWSQLGTMRLNSVDNAVNALLTSDGKVYVGGWFDNAGTTKTNMIALWNGTSWSALGSGMSGGYSPQPYTVTYVAALARDGAGHPYAGGNFGKAGAVSASNIARWDGSAWSSLGSGLSGPGFQAVSALALSAGGDLYAGGEFTTAGGVTVNGIAKWNGSAWSALGSGMCVPNANPPYLCGSGVIYALAIDAGGNVFAAGSFASAGGVTANNIAKWNGTNWSALGSGIDGVVKALAFDASGNLYAGGQFTTAGGLTVNGIAKWNGSTWSALGAGVGGCTPAQPWDTCYLEVKAIAVNGGDVYIGGNFTSAGSIPANYIAKWNGVEWSALGRGTDNPVGALAVSGTDLYVGGSFALAGGKPSANFALWSPLPRVSSFSTRVGKNQLHRFSPWDFAAHFSDLDGDSLTRIKITSLPVQGTLRVGATAVVLNEEIAFYDIGNLTYTPLTDWLGTTSFSWTGRDGTDYAASSATTTLVIADWRYDYLPLVGR